MVNGEWGISEYIALGALVYAIAQPWIIPWLISKFRPAIVEISFTGVPELMFDEMGPSMTVAGTISSFNNDIHVRDIELSIVRMDDGATRKCVWAFSRGSIINLIPPHNSQGELPGNFNVSKDTPHKFNIYFSDRSWKRKYGSVLEELTDEAIDLANDDDISFVPDQPVPPERHDLINKKRSDSGIRDKAYAVLTDNFFGLRGATGLT